MYEEWFEAREHERYFEATETGPLQAFLSWTISTEEATKHLILPRSTKSETASRKLWRLWTLVFDVATELPNTPPILVNLIREFQKRTVVHLKYESETIDWINAPNFDQNWREEGQRWINFSAFGARVVTAKLTAPDTVWGFFVIRDALEVEDQSPQLLNTDACAAFSVDTACWEGNLSDQKLGHVILENRGEDRPVERRA
ncbi:hypothetical protein MMC27_006688 [Xylographa pallens]|nr:hypothetical protein [Xylographa pallens]